MMPSRDLGLTASLLGLCIIAVGTLTYGGSLMIPRGERSALIGARAASHEELERLESIVPAGRVGEDGLWRAHLDALHTELEHGHVDVAVRLWHDAYAAALASRSWEGMIAVGDAFMTIGRTSGTPRGARMNARDAYMIALIRARRDHSVAGVLRSGEAFGQIDDHALAEQSFHVAARLAIGDEPAQQMVREARQRWGAPPTFTEF